MKRLIGLAIKILPLITLWQGLTSGGARLRPFIDTVKVALTQYEVAQIAQKVVVNLGEKGKLVPAHEFSGFIRENVYSQYSVLAREIKGDKTHDHAMDIWGRPFQLVHNQLAEKVKIVSAGPDAKIDTKDDVAVDFEFEIRSSERPRSRTHLAQNAEMDAQRVHPVQSEAEYDEYDEGRGPASEEPSSPEEDHVFDEEGYDQNGYDNNGYDREGVHYSEKESR